MGPHRTRSLETLIWTGRFTLAHLPLVLGLGLIAGVERVLIQLCEAPMLLGVMLEALVWVSRAVLVVAAIRIGIVADERFRRALVGTRVDRFLADHWPSWVLDGALLAAAFVLFSLPELWVQQRPDSEQALLLAVLLALKNLSIIPLTFLWMVGIARQAVLYEPAPERVAQR